MKISIPDNQKTTDVIRKVNESESGSTFSCSSERMFSLLKIALVKSQRSDLSIQLLDNSGKLLKQVVSRRKEAEEQESDELSLPQVKAVRALEEAFRQCQAMKLTVIGFSDGLVAVPEKLGVNLAVLSSTSAMDVDSSDVYKGFEADYDEDE